MTIDAKYINNWSDLPEAHYTFPILIRRLILATVGNPKVINVPGGSGVRLPNFDGTIESDGGLYIPPGKVQIEISVDKDPLAKANRDYTTRTSDSTILNKSDTTYVQIAARTWTKKKDWTEQKNTEKIWKEVIAVDAEDISQWLQSTEIVSHWFAKQIGLSPESGYITLADWWIHWAGATKPSLIPELIVAGRNEQKNQVVSWLQEKPSSIYIKSDTKDEAVGFLASSAQLEPDLSDLVMAKAILVQTLEAWNIFSKLKTPAILIPMFSDDFSLNESILNGHHVLFPLGKDETENGLGIDLPRTKRDAFMDSLGKMGLSREEADAILRVTGRHLPSVRRRLIMRAGGFKPKWATFEEAHILIPALLLGQWTESEADLNQLAKLGRCSIEDIQRDYQKLLNIPDSPLRKIGNNWRLTSHEEAWDLLSPYISKADLSTFIEVSSEILTELSPALDLDEGQRYMANILGKTTTYSGTIKNGISVTLALMGSRSEKLDASVQHACRNVLRRLVEIGKTDWKFWATHGTKLSIYVEASPEEVLLVIEDGVTNGSNVFLDLFNQEGKDSFWGSCYHSGLLWAIECLAWSDEYFTRCAILLAQLSEIDPGGRFSNRPFESLTTLFHSWIRFSEIEDNGRIATLKTLLEKFPKVGWKLLLAVLHDDLPTLRDLPHWRNWAQDYRQRATQAEHIEFVQSLIVLIRSQLSNDAEKWTSLVEHLSAMDGFVDLHELLTELENAVKEDSDKDQWSSLRNLLIDEIDRHRTYDDTDWALESTVVNKLEAILKLIEPESPVENGIWLYSHWPKTLKKFATDKEREEYVAVLREENINEVFKAEGFAGFSRLSEQVEQATQVGYAIYKYCRNIEGIENYLLENIESKSNNVFDICTAILFLMYSEEGMPKLINFISKAKGYGLSSVGIAKIYLVAKVSKETWDALESESIEVQSAYWNNINPFYFDRFNQEDFEFGINKLLDCNRAPDLVQSIAYSTVSIKKELIIRLLELLPKNINTWVSEGKHIHVQPHAIAAVFKKLDALETDLGVISKLEIPFLKSLSHDRPKLALHQEIFKDPSIFVDLITWSYKSSEESSTSNIAEGPDVRLADVGFHTLQSIHTVPGTKLDGSIDLEVLINWIEEVIKKCKERRRVGPALRNIGRILANSPVGEDGIWPTEEVRIVLEKFQCRDIETEFHSGKRNLRGITVRSPFAGGDQERDLANKFLQDAEKIRTQFPFTAKLLNGLAASYNWQAKSQDDDAEWDDK
ncbi:MAG: ATP-binding protein [Bacteroidetes bacterium]|nr:ATP-binding protein [Bacteroidota bacterium]